MDRIKNQKTIKLQIGKWTVIPLENCFIQGEQKSVVIPKVMDLLLYFSNHADQVISIQQLSEAIWPDEFVGDNAIYNLIGQLRKALGDNAAKPLYIETLSKKGYRLIAEVIHTSPFHTARRLLDEEDNGNKITLTKNIHKWLVMTICVLVTAYLMRFFMPFYEAKKVNLSLAEQQYSLGQFHLNKGQAVNIKKAINYFQQSLIIKPNNVPAMLDLGFAYLQLSHLVESTHSTHRNKALKLAKKIRGIAPNNYNVLALIHFTLAKNVQEFTHQQWLKTNDDPSLTHRTLITFSRAYFHIGKIDDAIELQNRALILCADCAYIYRALSASQLVKGDLEQAFSNFQIYLELNDGQANTPLKEMGYSHLTLSKLKATNTWIKTSGIEHHSIALKQRNPLALFYLSTRQPQKAEQLMSPALSNADNGFFTLYTLAALYGAQNKHLQSHALFEKRMKLYPENKRFVLSVAYSFWILGKTTEALKLLQQTSLLNDDVTSIQNSSDISLILLHGALLIDNRQHDKGHKVLSALVERFEQGLLGSSQQGSLAYAKTLALLSKNKLALKEIETTLANGWVEDFNNNWWYLEDDPFFKKLRDMDKFKKIIEQHHTTISQLSKPGNT